MNKISEDILKNWTKPPSNSEETKLNNAISIVLRTIKNHELIPNSSYLLYGKGSYKNNTNVRNNSDIDVDIKYINCFTYSLPKGKSKNDYNIVDKDDYDIKQFKNDVFKVLSERFGKENVKRKNKCINVKENTNRASIDIVPCFEHRRYYLDGSYSSGIKFISDKNEEIINFPEQHLLNGTKKNLNTMRRYKGLVRIIKKLRYKMKEDNIYCGKNISSYLLENLVYNVPDNIFTYYTTWNDRLKFALIYLHDNTIKKNDCKDWITVSEMFYFMRGHYKWSVEDVNKCMNKMYKYMGY